nr:DUF2807 domain-containing protein [Saprospiraceae bacterium]
MKNEQIRSSKNQTFFFALLVAAVLGIGCDSINGIEGEGPIITQELDIDEFEGIELDGSYDVIVRQGNEQFVEAEGHANIIDRLRTDVSGGIWLIDLLRGSYRNLRLTIYITTPALNSIRNTASGDIRVESMEVDRLDLELDGSGDIEVTEFLTIAEELYIEADGSGNIEVEDLVTQELNIQMDASGDIDLGGTADFADIDISGSGDLKAYAVEVNDMIIRSS